MYVPIGQLPDGVKALTLPLLPLAWIVRTHGNPRSFSAGVSSELRLVSGGLPVARTRSMEEVAAGSIARTQFNMVLMTVFGCAALLLAAIGIYGLMAYSTRLRTREIGIRLALGARPEDVKRMVLLQGTRLILVGVGIGIPASFGLTRLIASLLFGITPRDPFVFVVVPALLVVVAISAVWLPARRASSTDPIQSLRSE